MADEVIRKQVYITPQDLTGFIVSLGGIKFWAVAIFPMYVGWVLAQPAAERRLFVDDLGIVLGLLVIGPLLGTFTLLLNTYYDMETTDRANPRKQYVRVIEDLIDRETVLYTAWGFAALGLLMAAFISANLVPYGSGLGRYAFFVLMVLATVLSIAYSHPAMRLKGVAGMDLLVNVLGFGVICPLAGWSLLQPIDAFPRWWLLSAALFVGASYAPTTASDHDSDREYGIRTLAVALGMAGAIRFGFILLVAGVALLFYGGSVHAFPFTGLAAGALSVLWPFLLGQVVLYAAFLRRPTQGKTWALILLLTVLQGLSTLLFLYFFTGGRAYPR
ncbi:MAG TPA: UbiA family prenyltransferase [Thermoplasmata archaeon]|nr:UbiA family prenyltransferase [Thermoplasmata archaeon]